MLLILLLQKHVVNTFLLVFLHIFAIIRLDITKDSGGQ